MFCSECRYEYRDGVYVCSDCNVNLVDKLIDNQPEIISTSLPINKTLLKRFWILLGSAIGLFGILLFYRKINNIYWELIPDELFLNSFRLNILIDFIVFACISGLLIYNSYWGFRNLKPFGRVSISISLVISATLAVITTAYTIRYVYYLWSTLLLAIIEDILGYTL